MAKREELQAVNSELRERMAIVANDIEAVERVLGFLGHTTALKGDSTRAARIVLFYRNELRDYLRAELQRSPEPLTARELAQRLCQVERKDWQDRRLAVAASRSRRLLGQ